MVPKEEVSLLKVKEYRYDEFGVGSRIRMKKTSYDSFVLAEQKQIAMCRC